MKFRNLLKFAERKLGTQRAAGLYYGIIFGDVTLGGPSR